MSGVGADTPADGALIRPFVVEPATPGLREPAATAEAGVRPFLLTAGRTAPAVLYPLETQVVATESGRGAQQWLTYEYHDIVALAREPLAIAELAARLGLHLGVVRVLVGDLEGQGVVTTYQPAITAAGEVATILRVIQALRGQ